MRPEERVREQFPAVQLTLLSVLVGLVLDDLVDLARSELTLTPLTLETARTWGRLFGTGFCAIAAWCYYAMPTIAARMVPRLGETLIGFSVMLALLIVNSFIGDPQSWRWNAAIAVYVVIAATHGDAMVRIAAGEPELRALQSMAGFTPSRLLMIISAASYFAAAIADYRGTLPLWIDAGLALAGTPAVLIFAVLAYGEWHRALARASARET